MIKNPEPRPFGDDQQHNTQIQPSGAKIATESMAVARLGLLFGPQSSR